MNIPLSLLAAIIGSMLSAAIMLYIALATPMGPWIDTTIALLALIPIRLLVKSAQDRISTLVSLVVASGIAGIVATAAAFSLPAIGFIEPDFFKGIIQRDDFFWITALFGGLIICAGFVGIAAAYLLSTKLLDEEKLPFPLGSLVYETITAGGGVGKSLQLLWGILISSGMHAFLAVVPLVSRFDTASIFIAVGFIAGPTLVLPLIVGVVTRYGIIDPFRIWYFPAISAEQILLSFFTGIVLYGAFHSIASTAIAGLKQSNKMVSFFGKNLQCSLVFNSQYMILLYGIVLSLIYFWWVDLPIAVALFVIGATLICCQQLAVIAGRIGIAPLGRYATFVMVPALLIFRVTALHATLIAAYVEIAGGVTANALFGLKLARSARERSSRIAWYQILGLIVVAILCAILMVMLIKAFGLGSPELFALKARNRAWLITAYSFDWRLIAFGGVFAALLSAFSVNPVLVLGGLAMPIESSLMLAMGGLVAHRVAKPSDWYPLWSGIFAASSIWMMLKAFMYA